MKNSALAATQFNALLKGALFWPLIAGYGERRSKREQSTVIEEAVAMFLARYHQTP